MLGIGGSGGGGGGLLSLLGMGASGDSGGASGLLSMLGSFAGFLAGGGPAEHSHAYIVGEKGPELFKPDVSGTIIPSFSKMKPPQEGSLSNMGQAFAGFRAAGGDVTPGHAYMTGEKHPEVFMPSAARASAPSSLSGGGAREITFNMHIHGANDHDSFRRSQSQIYAGIHAQMELAKARG
jgi:hypothetical protein